MAESTRRRRASIGVLFWIAFILLLLVIFLANRTNIEQILESTGIVDVIRDRIADGGPPPESPESPPSEPASPLNANEADPDGTNILFESDNSSPAADASETQNENPAVDTPDAQHIESSAPEAQQDPSRPNKRMASLYFIRVTDDGRTYTQRVVHPVSYDQSPLTETIRALIAGPTGEELNDGLLNLIPIETRLISAHVEGGVAYLNFNQSFRFNPMGAGGTVAQLQQIIYSSTEFPTVTRVQFLIDGETLEYVGGDGIYIGEPLGRDAFSS